MLCKVYPGLKQVALKMFFDFMQSSCRIGFPCPTRILYFPILLRLCFIPFSSFLSFVALAAKWEKRSTIANVSDETKEGGRACKRRVRELEGNKFT